ncbi:hypothetical protein SAMN04487766_103232 [Actinomyces ruminicola]|uniref:Uncharacterized protein n=1 Tax=Actinomyces ruminicola TaxID=332524 RepID=A0A1G9U1K9_9ACTO|nr:hypothetical protein SAMN04487766_103232 [Actinomyces ruminicola]
MSVDVAATGHLTAAGERQREIAQELKASGALDEIFAQIDAGTPLTGEDGLLSGVVKAAPGCGVLGGRADQPFGL